MAACKLASLLNLSGTGPRAINNGTKIIRSIGPFLIALRPGRLTSLILRLSLRLRLLRKLKSLDISYFYSDMAQSNATLFKVSLNLGLVALDTNILIVNLQCHIL